MTYILDDDGLNSNLNRSQMPNIPYSFDVTSALTIANNGFYIAPSILSQLVPVCSRNVPNDNGGSSAY